MSKLLGSGGDSGLGGSGSVGGDGLLFDRLLALARRSQAGDESSGGSLYIGLGQLMVRWVPARMGERLRGKLEAEDLAQEIVQKIAADLPKLELRDARSFRAWLFGVAENTVRDAARRWQRDRRRTHVEEGEHVLPAEQRAASATGPLTAAAREEERGALLDSLAELSADHREVIRLHALEQLTLAEVAERMGRSENAVACLYVRACKALRGKLGARA